MNTKSHKHLEIGKSLITLVLFFSAFQVHLFGQGVDIQQRPVGKRLFIGINLMPAQSQIINEGSDLSLSGTPVNVINGSVEFGVFLGRRLGLNLGIGYGTFGELMQLEQHSGVFQAMDSENDAYEMRWTGSGIREEQNINYLAIPLGIRYQLPLSAKFALYAKGEIDFCLTLDKSYSSKGIYSYAGYYPAYNVLYSNLPEYGFPSDLNTDIEGDLEINSFRLLGGLSAGATFSLSKSMQISAGAVFMNSLSSIFFSSANTADIRLTDGPNKVNSLMELGDGVHLRSLGLNIALTYVFMKGK
jgi:hypothetical protein